MTKPKHAIVPDSMRGMIDALMYGHGYLCICGAYLKCAAEVTEDQAYERHVHQVWEDEQADERHVHQVWEDEQTDKLIKKMREHVKYYQIYNSEYYRRNPSQTARSYSVRDIERILNRLDSLTKE